MAENQVKVRPALTDLKVGGEITFPIAKTKSVRAQASDLGLILDRKYQTETDWKIQCKLPPKTKRFCPLVLK